MNLLSLYDGSSVIQSLLTVTHGNVRHNMGSVTSPSEHIELQIDALGITDVLIVIYLTRRLPFESEVGRPRVFGNQSFHFSAASLY